MLTLNDGRNELWQWDTGRKLTVDADCSQVHFSNKVFGRSIDVDVVDGTAAIPDVLLQVDKELIAWAFVGTAENGYTKISKVFKVNKRNKPADYVFTPTEQTTLDEIMKRLDRIEEGQDPDAIKNAVDEYLANNPIQVEEKDPTVPDWAKEKTKPAYTAAEVGAVAADELNVAVAEALAQAKESGEFDGADGKDGQNGVDGYTPIKGVDYFDGEDGQDGSPGKDGSDGVSVTHSWNGTVLTITSASGTSSSDLKGAKGDKGDKGDQGIQGIQGEPGADGAKGDKGDTGASGTSVTVKSVSESTADGGSNVVTFSDGKTVTIKNGSKGSTGAAGKDAVVTMYISPDGSDSNDGLTADKPKKTVKACVNAGASRISAKRGVYAEQVAVSGVEHLEIYPTDNGQEYSTDADWPPIVFDLSDTLAPTSLEAYNSIKRIAYTNSANEQFDKVFAKKSQSPVYDEYGKRYNATVWLMSNDEKTVCIKLKPVLTVAECEAETNTFAWVSGYLYINADMTGVEKICVPTNFDSGFRVADAGTVILREVEVRFSGSYNVWLLNCSYFDFYKVSARYSSYASGIDIDNANGRLNACYATKNFDGFGVSGYGHTTYVDCVSEFNFDDGVSHHNGSCGTFIGGRYEGNGKGGNTPAYGAQVNIYGGIYKDNAQFGIGYLYTTGKNPASGMVQGAALVGNAIGLTVNKNCAVTAINCLYDGNTTDKNVGGTLTEYNFAVSGSGGSGEVEDPNLLPTAIGSDSADYVGDNGEDGYRVGYRISSSGVEKENAANCITGFIAAVSGDVIRVKNITLETSGYSQIQFYDASFVLQTSYTIGSAAMVSAMGGDGIMTFTVPTAAAIAYFRVCTGVIDDTTIITKNAEITE